MKFAPGDPVSWMREQRGYYGLVVRVPAVFVGRTSETHAKIDALLADGSFRRRRVKISKLWTASAAERQMVAHWTATSAKQVRPRKATNPGTKEKSK